MKLGVNHKTGSNWSLISWLAQDDPASGAFPLEWEPKTRRLVIKRRGVPYWSSGLQLSSSKNESLFEYIYPTKDSSDRGRSEWQLQYWGPIMDRSTSIMKMNFCYGYGMEAEGCERWDQPKCRYYNQTFEQKSGFFKHIGPDGLPQDEAAGSVDDDNTTIGPADCRARCWNNCDCRGFNGDEGTGCQYWTGNVKFEPDDGVSRSRILKYVLTDPPKDEIGKSNDKGNEKWIVPVIVTAILVLFLGTYSLWRIYRQRVDVERREEKHLLELTTPDRLLDADELEKDGNARHNIKVFSFACIAAATNNFSPETKLGEGGFGPVYRGSLPEGREIAVKRIFKRDGLEANTNRIVGTYGYMSPEYAMEGIFSEKSDVFSFGVLMLEIVSGRKNNNFYNVNGPRNLIGYAWELWQRDAGKDIMDPTLKDSCPMHQLLRFIHVALSCLEDSAADRPTILENGCKIELLFVHQ
nr:receptor-like serine/threonine-protein kinase sd1-7 [Quercus suber]